MLPLLLPPALPSLFPPLLWSLSLSPSAAPASVKKWVQDFRCSPHRHHYRDTSFFIFFLSARLTSLLALSSPLSVHPVKVHCPPPHTPLLHLWPQLCPRNLCRFLLCTSITALNAHSSFFFNCQCQGCDPHDPFFPGNFCYIRGWGANVWRWTLVQGQCMSCYCKSFWIVCWKVH